MDRRTFLSSAAVVLLMLSGMGGLQAQSGSISANPNPYEIYLTRNTCSVTISWNSQGVSLVEVWVSSSSGESLFSRTASGPHSKDAAWIQDREYTFSLYDYSGGTRGALLAAVMVTGVRVLKCEPMQ